MDVLTTIPRDVVIIVCERDKIASWRSFCKDGAVCEARAFARISGVVVYGDTTHENERRRLIRAPTRQDRGTENTQSRHSSSPL